MPREMWIEALHMKDWDSLGDYEFGNTTRPVLKGTVGVEHMKDSVYAETCMLIKKRLDRYTTEKIEESITDILSHNEPALIRIIDKQGEVSVRRYENKNKGYIYVEDKRVKLFCILQIPRGQAIFS